VPETTVTLDRDRKITANFERKWNLIVYPHPDEGGTTSGSSPEPVGTTVTINATPNKGYTFERWEGPGVADPFAAETTITIESETHDVAAIFQAEENEDENQDQNQDQNQESDQDQESDPNQDEGENQDSEQPEDSDEPDANEDSEQPEDSEAQEDDSPTEPEQPEEQEGESEESEETEGESGSMRAEGEMTEEEAKQLLNVLRETEQKLPARRRPITDDPSTERDW